MAISAPKCFSIRQVQINIEIVDFCTFQGWFDLDFVDFAYLIVDFLEGLAKFVEFGVEFVVLAS